MEQFEKVLAIVKAWLAQSDGYITGTDVWLIAREAGVDESQMRQLYYDLQEAGIDIDFGNIRCVRQEKAPEEESPSYKLIIYRQFDGRLERALKGRQSETHRAVWERLERWMEERDENYRQVYAMKGQGRTAAEIAEALNCTREAVYTIEKHICGRLELFTIRQRREERHAERLVRQRKDTQEEA